MHTAVAALAYKQGNKHGDEQEYVELKGYREIVAGGCSTAMDHYRNQKLRPWCPRAGMALSCLMQMLAMHSRLAKCAAHLDTVNQRHRFVSAAAALPHLLHAVMLLKAASTKVSPLKMILCFELRT